MKNGLTRLLAPLPSMKRLLVVAPLGSQDAAARPLHGPKSRTGLTSPTGRIERFADRLKPALRTAADRLKPALQTLAVVYASIGLALLVAEAQIAPPAAAPLPRRYVFLLDTSFSMNRVAEATRTAVRELIAGGVQQRMQPGDQFEVWTFDERTYTQQFPARTWTAESSQELAALAFAFANRLRFENRGRLNSALAELNKAVQQTPALTAFILTDGEDSVRGTPFDAELNAALRRRRRELRQAKQPFLMALESRQGQLAAWAVNAPGEPLNLPPLEPAPPPARPQPVVAAAQPGPPQPAEAKPSSPPSQPLPEASPPPAPKPVTVFEPPPAPAPAPAPAQPAREAESAPPAPAQPAQPVAPAEENRQAPAKESEASREEARQPVAAPPEPAPVTRASPPLPDAKKEGTGGTPDPISVSPPAEPPPAPPTPARAEEVVSAKPEPPRPSPQPAVAPTPGEAKKVEPEVHPLSTQKQTAAIAQPAKPPAPKTPPRQTALITPEPSSPQRWLQLGVGTGLLGLGSWLCYWFVRRRRPVRPASLISRSLERRDDNAAKPAER